MSITYAHINNEALHFAREHKLHADEAWALRALGEIVSSRDPVDTAEAETCYRGAMVLAEALGMCPLVAHCHVGIGKLRTRMGKRQQAEEHLTTAATMYRNMEMRSWLLPTEAVMLGF